MRSIPVALLVVLASSPVAAQPATPDADQPEEPTPAPPVTDTAEKKKTGVTDGFAFGSYGRVGFGSDLRGSTPEKVSVVTHGSRIVEANYAELDLYYHMRTESGVKVRTVTTIGFKDNLFHYTGDFSATMALRNLYAHADLGNGVRLWVGSRLYRGDDVYLLDMWALDEVNTLGGGAAYRRDKMDTELHVGVNRLNDPFQFSEREVADPELGSRTIVELDRQRLIASAKSTYRVWGPPQGPAVKAKLYAEMQSLPDGTRTREDDSIETLPSDFGWTLGAQLGAWGFAEGFSHANLFVRFSQGLTAFDELQVPMGFDASKRTYPNASTLMIATSLNYEFPGGGVIAGGYVRRFVDADTNAEDRDDGWEYIADIRPHVRVVDDFEAAIDVSYQARFPRGLSPTALVALDPAVFQIAPMINYSPFGTSSYARPQFRLVYRAANLNKGARDLYALDDPRRTRSWVHYLGLQAEWWFNSSYR